MENRYTPKHGGWLNMAEIELSVLAKQCLGHGRLFSDQGTLGREVGAWEQEGNGKGRTIDWRFTTADARIKLKHLYPSFDK